MKAILSVKSEGIYRKWEEYILDKLREPPKPQANSHRPESFLSNRYNDIFYLIDDIFKQQVFTDIKGNVLKETRLQHTLEMLKRYIEPAMLGVILVRIAKSSCTLSLAKQLLSYGAPVDYPWVKDMLGRLTRHGTGMTALHAAAKKATKDAALLMQLLILNGAGQDMERIREEQGAKELQQFIGASLDDLIELQWQQYKSTILGHSDPSTHAERFDLTDS
ncbi:hypothetical protein BDV06DRAFT_220229 [Aspergillus oleicola]